MDFKLGWGSSGVLIALLLASLPPAWGAPLLIYGTNPPLVEALAPPKHYTLVLSCPTGTQVGWGRGVGWVGAKVAKVGGGGDGEGGGVGREQLICFRARGSGLRSGLEHQRRRGAVYRRR